MTIGEIIKELREEKDLSLRALALALEVDHKSVWAWEHGVKEPKASSLVKLADYFDVTTDYLLGRDKYP